MGSKKFSQLIWKEVGWRILFCYLLILLIIFVIFFFEIRGCFNERIEAIDRISNKLSTFIITQTILNNQDAISLKIKELNLKYPHTKYLWVKGKQITSKKKMQWVFPLSWKYYLPIKSSENNYYGYLLISGNIISHEILSNFIMHIFLLCLFYLSVMLLLQPLMKKIPQKIFFNPIMELLYFLRTSDERKNWHFKKLPIDELNEIAREIMNLIEQKEKLASDAALGRVAVQVAHDIRSPASAILILSKELSGLTYDQRASLTDAANRVQRIADELLNQYGNRQNTFEAKQLLIAQPILSVISEEKMLHKDISFDCDFSKGASFSFINIDRVEFERVLVNIINNAAESVGKNGKITIKLSVEGSIVKLSIIDNGEGIPDDIVQNIKEGKKVSSSKKNGYGLGWDYIRSTLNKRDAEFSINSKKGYGTEINLLFKLEPIPVWLAKTIQFFPNDVLIFLDDDLSMHNAWDRLLSEYVREFPKLLIKHFDSGIKCIEYIQSLNKTDNNKVFLLADYELNGQEINGLEVIEAVSVQRAVLVTSHYENKDIIRRAILNNVKILPKILAHEVIYEVINKEVIEDCSDVDLILIDDARELSDIIKYLYARRGKKLIVYNDWYPLIYLLNFFSKDTKICFDYNLNCPITGIDLAKIFYEKGFKNLYLATGYKMKQADVPSYIALLNNKMDLLNL